MKLLDLFAGIGGFSLAAHRMGWETVGFVEWDDFCQKVLKKNFPNIPIYGDIKKFNEKLRSFITNPECMGWEKGSGKDLRQQEQKSKGQNIGNICKEIGFNRPDIITGGFPCQPFSQAGKRKGTDDSRYLWDEMLETIRILKPSFVVGENVAGLVSMENGKTLDRILADLEDEGYTVESFVIPACAVGAWHRRDRIWIVAYNNTIRCNNGELPLTKRNESRSKSFNRDERLDKDVSDTECKRGCSRNTSREYAEDVGKLRGSEKHRYRHTEPGLGGMVDGLSPWLDEPGIPRVARGVKDRVNRLKALGNSIVPQIAFEIFKAIETLKKHQELFA